jgi:hypothetical protein
MDTGEPGTGGSELRAPGREPGTIGVMPGGGGGTDTGRFAGGGFGVRVGRPAAAAGAIGGGVTGRGVTGGAVTGAGATGGLVIGRGIAGMLAAAGSWRLRRPTRVGAGSAGVGGTACRVGSGAARRPALRRPAGAAAG